MTQEAVIRVEAGGRAYEQRFSADLLFGICRVFHERCEAGKLTAVELSVTEGRDDGSVADFEAWVLLGAGSSVAFEFPRGFQPEPSILTNVIPALHESADNGHTFGLGDSLSNLIYEGGHDE